MRIGSRCTFSLKVDREQDVADGRRQTTDETIIEDLEFRPFDRLRSSFSDVGTDVFLLKVSYWLGI